jgi:hypothetical protein
MLWTAKHPRAIPEMLGYIPIIIIEDDPRSAKEQIAERYTHGGGYSPFRGHTMLPNGNLKYPGDPETQLLFETILHKDKPNQETLRFYEHAWLGIIQLDETFEIVHMD